MSDQIKVGNSARREGMKVWAQEDASSCRYFRLNSDHLTAQELIIECITTIRDLAVNDPELVKFVDDICDGNIEI